MSFEEKGFRFGEFFLKTDEGILKRNGVEVQLTPKAIELLTELVRNQGHVVSKNQLMDSVWADSMVEEANLPFTIGLVRKALGDDVKNPRFVETLSKKGYRFIAPVEEVDGNGNAPAVNGANLDLNAAIRAQPADLLTFHARPTRRYLFFAALTFIGLTIAIVFWGLASKLRTPLAGNMAVKHITANGETKYVSASPDGKFLAYVLDKGDHQSLWLYNVATDSDLMLSPTDARENITAVAFAPDGEHIYYVSSSRLIRVPILRGNPDVITDNVSAGSNVTVSPDGKQAAFLRSSGEETDIVVATVADRSERVLATSQRPRQFYSRLAWSPDGRSLACAKRGIAGEGLAIVILNADDGTETERFKMREVVSDLAWKYDGTAVLTSACGFQICRILQYDLGRGNEPVTLTNDLINYTSISMAADGSSFFAVREDAGANLYVLSAGGDQPAKQITTGFDRFDGLYALSWVSGDRMFYSAQPREKSETDSIRADGSDQREISKEAYDGFSADGRYLVSPPSHAVEPVISVFDMVSGKSSPISSGYMDINHTISPDGQWTAFTRLGDDVGIWRMSISGGDAARLTAGPDKAVWPAISPDGRFVAFCRPYVDANGKATVDIAYVDSMGGSDLKRFAVDAQMLETGKAAPQWSADGKSLYFVRLRDGASNIWKQPLDGSEPTQLTHLKSGRIYNFMFSPDESQIALSYSSLNRDIVQIDYRSGS